MENTGSWREWFEREEYFLIYSHRNEREAQQIVDFIVASGHINQGALVLDAGCGYGRISKWLVKSGFRVVGVDLSKQMINHARKNMPQAIFIQHDLRFPYWDNLFDCAISIFSSFGYWEDDLHNLAMLESIARAMRNGGLFVLDYLNPHYVKKNLIPEETLHIEDKTFNIKRWIANNMVYKEISWTEGNKTLKYREQLKLINIDELIGMLECAGFIPLNVYGNYRGEPFSTYNSERTIIFCVRIR